MWIRSKDREILANITEIEIVYDYLCCDEVQLYHIKTDKGTIGDYSTLERALEVLDEIQNYINNQYGDVYEMPEE